LVIGCAPSLFECRAALELRSHGAMLNYPPANTTGSHSGIEGVVTARPRPLSHEIICNTADGNMHCLHSGNHGSGGHWSRCRPCGVISERGGTEVLRRQISTFRRWIRDRRVEHGRRSDRVARLRRHPPARQDRATARKHRRICDEPDTSRLELRCAGGLGEIARQLIGKSRRSCRRLCCCFEDGDSSRLVVFNHDVASAR
jgi:hypothetical protein